MKSLSHATSEKRPLPHRTTIRDLMTLAPHTIGSDQKLSTAHKVMREHGLRHLPVLRGGRLVGVLSQRDLYFLESIAGVDVDIDTVTDAMSPDVYTIGPEDDVRAVSRVMAESKYGCAVVLERGHIVGIFTVTDALLHLANALPAA
jgi:acetoin utilization protein AcuB